MCLVPTRASTVEDSSPSVTHAVLINGGQRPASNYLSHFHHLQDMVELLENRGIPRERIHVFSADGSEPTLDLAVRDLPPPGFWLIQDLPEGRRLRPRGGF